MDLKLQTCVGCDSILTIDMDKLDVTNKSIYPCPICGTFNDVNNLSKVCVTLTSTDLNCEAEGFDDNTEFFVISDITEDVKSAIKTLTDNGWVVNFVLVGDRL
jgi:hypothetical protein